MAVSQWNDIAVYLIDHPISYLTRCDGASTGNKQTLTPCAKDAAPAPPLNIEKEVFG